jgi:hypothetical protein
MRRILTVILLLFPIMFVNSEQNVEYILQVLEPTGGNVERPSSWYFNEHHSSINSLRWVISKENYEYGGYETGLAIQFMIGAQKSSGLPLNKVMQQTLEHIARAGKELSRCEPENIGFFTRQCLEVEEKQSREGGDIVFHVQYSFFWNIEMDMAAITIAGSPVELWDENKEIFNRMSKIELIDVNRFKAK